MAAPFVIPMLNSVDFIAEDDYIADEGENVSPTVHKKINELLNGKA